MLRELLMRHSANYEFSTMRVRCDGKLFKVALSGDGSTFCLNKQEEHNSQHVYMEVRPGRISTTYESVMKCWCGCAVVRPGGKVHCKNFVSKGIPLSADQASTLFASNSNTQLSAREKYLALHKKHFESA